MEHLHIALFRTKEQAGREPEEDDNCGFLVHILSSVMDITLKNALVSGRRPKPTPLVEEIRA
jgi:hypothetical protein